jgi:hypothetical protein
MIMFLRKTMALFGKTLDVVFQWNWPFQWNFAER